MKSKGFRVEETPLKEMEKIGTFAQKNILSGLCVCAAALVCSHFHVFFLCHTDQNIRRGQPTDSLDTGAAPFLKHFLLS